MEFFNIEQLYYILRIIVAGMCGILIGLERKNRSKEAGVRTHCVVACASALMMIISKYGFADTAIGEVGVRGADGARIAAQVVSGIGFLGAGLIFVHRNTITGLTTAAGIWATSGVGMAIGAGMYVVGVTSAGIIVLVQILLHRDFKWLKNSKSKKLSVKGVDVEGYQQYLTDLLAREGVVVYDVYVEKTDNDNCNYTFMIEIPQNVCEEKITRLVDYKCKISANI